MTNTFTFSNPTASDELCGFVLFLTNGGSQTVTWPGTVDWPSATAPTLSASGVDIIVFQTIDGDAAPFEYARHKTWRASGQLDYLMKKTKYFHGCALRESEVTP